MKNFKGLLLVAILLSLLAGVALWRTLRLLSPSENSVFLATNLPAPAVVIDPLGIEPVPSQSAEVTETDSAGPRTFADMPSRDRRAIVGEIRKLDFDSIMKAWVDAGRVEHDPMKQAAIASIWSTAMREKSPQLESYEKMKAFINDPANSSFECGQLIGVLAAAATKEAAALLIYEATTQIEAGLKNSAIGSIGNLGGGGSREYLPAMIEPLWRESNDPQLIKAVAVAMAEEGAPSSINLLLPAAAAPDGQDDVRRDAALWALNKVYTKNAVPPLSAALDSNPVGTPTHTLAFKTLTQITDETAAQALLHWLQAADSRSAPLATKWITEASYPSQLRAAEAALNPSMPFRDEKNREAIRAGLAAYRAGHKLK